MKFVMRRSSSAKLRKPSRFTTTIFLTCTNPQSRFSYKKQKPNRRGRFNALRSQKRTFNELDTSIWSANKTTSTTWRIRNCRKKSRRGLACLKKSTNGWCRNSLMRRWKTTSGKWNTTRLHKPSSTVRYLINSRQIVHIPEYRLVKTRTLVAWYSWSQ